MVDRRGVLGHPSFILLREPKTGPYNPNEPRDAEGRWTDDPTQRFLRPLYPTMYRKKEPPPPLPPGLSPHQVMLRKLYPSMYPKDSPIVEVSATLPPATPEEKERFIRDHYDEAKKIADKLGVPVETILGIAAIETSWGRARFATEGNNFFGQHYSPNVPDVIGWMQSAADGKMAVFSNPDGSFDAFMKPFGPTVAGVQDPREAARKLQDRGAFGVNNDGSKVPTYPSDVANTARGIAARLNGRGA